MEKTLRNDPVTKRSRKGKTLPFLSISSPDDEQELRLVMREIADALGAIAIVLTTQEDDGSRSEVLRISDTVLDECLLHRLFEEEAFLYKEPMTDEHNWQSVGVGGMVLEVMTMPVKRTTGHQRLVVSALFSGITQDARAAADKVYLARRPFAMGYFRLWQIDRVRQKRETALEAALDSFGFGVTLLDSDSNIVFANDAASELFALGDGLKAESGRILATNLKDAVRLRAALDHVTATNVLNAPMISISRDSMDPLIIIAIPIEWEERDIGNIAAIVYIIDPTASSTVALEALCRIYRLTLSETKLACLLATGTSLANAAEKLRVKEQTARSVLKQIFRKTRTVRQGELITLMFRSIQTARQSVRIEAV